jgi:hypothetical protein
MAVKYVEDACCLRIHFLKLMYNWRPPRKSSAYLAYKICMSVLKCKMQHKWHLHLYKIAVFHKLYSADHEATQNSVNQHVRGVHSGEIEPTLMMNMPFNLLGT